MVTALIELRRELCVVGVAPLYRYRLLEIHLLALHLLLWISSTRRIG